MIEIGCEFRVGEVVDFLSQGELVARYRPEFSYVVTERNFDFVTDLVFLHLATVDEMTGPQRALRSWGCGGGVVVKHIWN